MSEQENLILARRYVDEFMNKRDLDLADEIIAPDFTHTLLGFGDTHGREAWKQTVQAIVDAMPDAQWTVDEMVAQGDTVVVRWTFAGTHSGSDWAGWPAAGNKISTPMVVFFYFAEGKIASGRSLADSLDMWQQFGVIPPLAEMIEQAKRKE